MCTTLDGFLEEFGEDYAKEALWNLMTLATAGDVSTTKPSILGFLNGAVMPNVKAAKDRYAAAVENGKHGGRPKQFDDSSIEFFHEQGYTNQQVAEKLGCSVSTVEKALARMRKP